MWNWMLDCRQKHLSSSASCHVIPSSKGIIGLIPCPRFQFLSFSHSCFKTSLITFSSAWQEKLGNSRWWGTRTRTKIRTRTRTRTKQEQEQEQEQDQEQGEEEEGREWEGEQEWDWEGEQEWQRVQEWGEGEQEQVTGHKSQYRGGQVCRGLQAPSISAASHYHFISSLGGWKPHLHIAVFLIMHVKNFF